MGATPFTAGDLPGLGTAVRIAFSTEKPTGEKFAKGEPAVVSELVLAGDGRVWVGARTPDGRVLRATFYEAFVLLNTVPP